MAPEQGWQSWDFSFLRDKVNPEPTKVKPRGAPEASTGDRHGLEKTGQGPRCELLGRLAALPGALQEPKVALELMS